MKTRITLSKRSLQVYIAVISVICIFRCAFAMEPIGTIGQPVPGHHAFLPDGNILRAVPTHIQVIDSRTGKVIDEFGEYTYISEVVFSPTAEHLAILNYASDSRITTISIWDTNAREQIAEWEIPAHINVAAFSPIGTLLAISFNDEIHLWNWQIGAFRGKMIGQRRLSEECHSRVNGGTTCSSRPRDNASVFTPNGRYLIVASNRPDVELWDVETRRLVGHFEGHTRNWVEGVVISPDGTYIATFERGPASVYVWDMGSRQLLWKEQSGSGRISDVVFSPDSQHLYVATESTWQNWDDQVRVWNVPSGQQIDTFGSEFRALEAITLSPNGRTLLLHYWDAVVVWDIEKKQPLNVCPDFVRRWFRNLVRLSPDGETAVSISRYFIKTWGTASGQMRRIISAEGGKFRGLAISPDSQKLAVGRAPWVEIRNLQTGNIETQFPQQHTGWLEKIVFSGSGRWIATVNDWERLSILDTQNPENLQKLQSENDPASLHIHYQIVFSKNDEYFAASGRTKDHQYWIQLWKRQGDIFAFQYAWQVPELYNSSNSTLTFTSNTEGSTVLVVSAGSELHIWKLLSDNPHLLTTLDGYDPVHFSPEGRYLFANQNGYLQIWNWQTQTPLKPPPIPEYFDISRDSSVLLSYTNSGQIHIWDGSALLPSQPVAVEPGSKQIVILGEVKRNQLLQNFPNPFNPETWIPFQLTAESHVTIHIHNATGQLVRRLSAGTMPAGDYSSQAQAVYWDGRNQVGEPVSSGVYLYTIHAGDFSATRKMLIRK